MDRTGPLSLRVEWCCRAFLARNRLNRNRRVQPAHRMVSTHASSHTRMLTCCTVQWRPCGCPTSGGTQPLRSLRSRADVAFPSFLLRTEHNRPASQHSADLSTCMLTGAMGRSAFTWAVAAVVVLAWASTASAEKNPILYCDACKAVVDEVDWAIKQGATSAVLPAACLTCVLSRSQPSRPH